MTVTQLAVIGVYLLAMLVLAVHGFHRHQLVYLFYRHSKRSREAPPGRFEDLPRVTIQLPVYNERFVVDRLLETVCQVDYPRDRLEIQVLDDSNDETQAVARTAVQRLRYQGHTIEYYHRGGREGFKAGALSAGLKRARGEFLAVFDADFSPPRDFLHRTIHRFTDPRVGAVQARWTFRNRRQSCLTRLQAIFLDAHFVVEHGARSCSGRFFNFNGSAGVLRRTMIDDAGGWQGDTLTEDTDLSYRAQMKGWKYVYLPSIEVESELPSDMASFQTQQARWAKGLIQTAKKILPSLLRSDLPVKVKLEALFHLTSNCSCLFLAVLGLLALPSLSARVLLGGWGLLTLDLLLFFSALGSFGGYCLAGQKELFPSSWVSKATWIPLAMVAAAGLMVGNCIAVTEGLLGVPSPFERTAKYGANIRTSPLARRQYATRSFWLPLANSVAGGYFVLCAAYSFYLGNWWALPWLSLLASGCLLTAAAIIWQWCDRCLANDHGPPGVPLPETRQRPSMVVIDYK